MATRSRRGCATCRKRKKKCDEARPECGQCLARSVRCGGYETRLTWSNTVATRGHLAGRAAPFKAPTHEHPSPDATTSRTATNTSESPAGAPHEHSSPLTTLHQDSPGHVTAPDSSTPYSVAGWEPPLVLPIIGDEYGPILEKFFNEGIHRLYAKKASECAVEAMRDALPGSPVLRLVCATLQEVLSNGSSVLALEQTGKALEMFRREMMRQTDVIPEESFMAGLLLCTLHLIQGLPWTSTFYQFLDVCHGGIDLSLIRPNPRYHLGMRHLIENMSILDMPLFVLGRSTASRGLWPRFRELQSAWDGPSDGGVEPITGLPRTLLDLLSSTWHNHDEDKRGEELLWDWSGQIGSALWECHLWDCYKYAGILAIRHRQSLEAPSPPRRNAGMSTSPGGRVPSTDLILFRLFSCLSAVLNEKNWEASGPPQAQHLALFPLVAAQRRMNDPWREDLQRMRRQILALDTGSKKHTLILFGILDEAWESGSDGFDADAAARRHEVEITII